MQQKKNWFLRKNDGSEYGPVSLNDLLRWSAQCRIIAGNAVSTDREEWTPVETLPELKMDWVALRADGKEYGPFALEAVQELFDHNVLPADAILVNRRNGENKPLAEVIAPPDPEAGTPGADTVPPDEDTVPPDEDTVPPDEDTVSSDEDTVPPDGDTVPPDADSPEPGTEKDAESLIPDPSAAGTSEPPRPPKPKREPRSARRPATPQQPELPGAVPEEPVPGSAATDTPAAVPPEEDSTGTEETTPVQSVREAGEDVPVQPAGEDLADARRALEDCTRFRQQELDNFNRQSELLRKQVESLQRKLVETQKATTAQLAAQAGECQSLQTELDNALIAVREAGIRLEALEAERGNVIQESAEDLADLRKQTAFMKKNIAVLHAEIAAARKQSQQRGRILLVLGAILTLAAAIQLMRATGGGCHRSRPNPPASTPSAAPSVSGGTTGTARQGVPAQDIRETRPAAVSTQPSWPSIRTEGVRLITERDRLLIRFEDGVFSSLATLTPEAAVRLRSIADQLRPHMDRFRLVVEGHTDDIQMRPTAAFANNQALAAARGEAVAAFLRRDGALPAAGVTVSTAPATAPYPNDTPENRRRNRTVVLRLVPRTTP